MTIWPLSVKVRIPKLHSNKRTPNSRSTRMRGSRRRCPGALICGPPPMMDAVKAATARQSMPVPHAKFATVLEIAAARPMRRTRYRSMQRHASRSSNWLAIKTHLPRTAESYPWCALHPNTASPVKSCRIGRPRYKGRAFVAHQVGRRGTIPIGVNV
jgi:hypothetical protein